MSEIPKLYERTAPLSLQTSVHVFHAVPNTSVIVMQNWLIHSLDLVIKAIPSSKFFIKNPRFLFIKKSIMSGLEVPGDNGAKDPSSSLSAENESSDVSTEAQEATVQRSKYINKRHKFALLLSYCGFGYYGLQRNPGYKTIEEEVLKALLKTHNITEEDYERISNLHFQRAARTDKGVSAAVQVLSLRLPVNFPNDVDQVNEHLPDEIQLIGAIRTTKFFDSKNFCDGRTYSYMMPTFALAPPESITSEDYRITPEIVKEFRDVLSIFKGTHNFHNYTSGKEATDASAKRYIVSIEASDPFMKEGLEVIIVRIRGQSFMMHQIRKMIGTAIAVMRGFASMETLKDTFKLDIMDLPRAPGLGLMLEDIHYDRYNHKFGGKGIHERLEWRDKWAEKVNDFKQRVIYPVMLKMEKEEKSMLNWLQFVPLHTYSKRETREYSPEPRTVLGEAMYNASGMLRPEEEDEAETDDKDNGDGHVPEAEDENVLVDENPGDEETDEPVPKKIKSQDIS